MDKIEKLTMYWSQDAINDRLYLAIRLNDTAMIERLRAQGIGLSEHIRGMLKSGGGSLVNLNEYGHDWYDFCGALSDYSQEKFIAVVHNLRAELGEPIYFSDSILPFYGKKLYQTEIFRCVLDCFDNKRMKKNWTLWNIIDNNRTELLEIAAEHGWFKLAKKCDEYIEYARKKNCVEAAAWLLDYKGRAFDAAKEREKAEKRQNAELNASPNSIMMLKKLWLYQKLEDGGIRIKQYKGDKTEITVPEKIGKDTVTSLEVDIYKWGTPRKRFVSPELKNAVTKVTLPKGLLSIGGSVFYEFTKLCDINIPDGVLSIGDYAFIDCKMLRALTLPDSVREIGTGAFQGCEELEKINIPQGITKISSYTFWGCTKLKNVEIPNSVQIIEEDAFALCKSIESVTIPMGVADIGKNAFVRCEGLTHVELPDTVEKICSGAFNGCSSLKEIVIPEGVREIGDVAFGHCAALERVVLPASLEKAKNYTQKGIAPKTIFDNSPKVTAVVTPKSYAERYCKRNNISFVYKEN
ncbi:MAG: leucine-rich repeat domain-containing protein [Oscillospiraceae bacterium]|nr:leucine-rich repeat domain-containing protein [Oscillospiraceae bacterium]